jgi:predicted hydrocarbon binding protein
VVLFVIGKNNLKNIRKLKNKYYICTQENNNMQQTIQLIEKALVKANNDLNNQEMEVNYTPDFLIELLTELKETLTPKAKVDVYEIRREYSNAISEWGYYIYKNNNYVSMAFSIELAQHKLEEIKKNTKVEVMHREEVISE